MNVTKSGTTQITLALLAGLTTLISFGQDSPTNEASSTIQPETLGPGDRTRTLMMGEQKRTCLVHVPRGYPQLNQAQILSVTPFEKTTIYQALSPISPPTSNTPCCNQLLLFDL